MKSSEGKPTKRIAILDLYDGKENQGMRCLREIIQQFGTMHGLDLSWDEFDVRIDSGRIVLLVKKRAKGTARIIKDPLTGLPVLTAGRNARVLTSDDVAKILEDFPWPTQATGIRLN